VGASEPFAAGWSPPRLGASVRFGVLLTPMTIVVATVALYGRCRNTLHDVRRVLREVRP
jgi:hypothetical protein